MTGLERVHEIIDPVSCHGLSFPMKKTTRPSWRSSALTPWGEELHAPTLPAYKIINALVQGVHGNISTRTPRWKS